MVAHRHRRIAEGIHDGDARLGKIPSQHIPHVIKRFALEGVPTIHQDRVRVQRLLPADQSCDLCPALVHGLQAIGVLGPHVSMQVRGSKDLNPGLLSLETQGDQ